MITPRSRIIAALEHRSLDRIPVCDSDGNLDSLLPEFIETGFDLIHLLEARAGNNAVTIKKKYGAY